jgi:FtsZ-binding cell division protein ZapB
VDLYNHVHIVCKHQLVLCSSYPLPKAPKILACELNISVGCVINNPTPFLSSSLFLLVQLPVEERDKRRVRRERNKLAAAKCRQRRVDHTNTLIGETEDWEEKNATLEQEISKLHQQKEQLEFILEAHKAMCRQNKANKQTATTSTATSTCSLETPTSEVVTPTSVFNYSVGAASAVAAANGGEAGDNMMSCGREAAIKSESGASDMSSPESNRTLIQL